MPPFLAQQRLRNASAAAATPPAPAPPPVTINMSNLAQPAQTPDNDPNNPNNAKGKVETLFGPPVGVGGTPAPEWTILAGKAELKEHGNEEEEELTMDVVQEWIRRNKEESAGDKPVATTTLQALVNLKRPSIKLTPLTLNNASSSEETPHQHAAAHGLEFDFDCDAARCAISIRAVVPAPTNTTTDGATPSTTYPPAAANDNEKDSKKKKQQSDSPSTQWTTISLFDTTIDGGFGKIFKFDEHGAVLELDKLDVAAPPPTSTNSSTPEAKAGSEGGLLSPAAGVGQQQQHHRKRFSAFTFRRRDAAGPALQVVDADAEAQAAAARRAEAAAAEDEDHPATASVANPAYKGDTGEDSGAKVVIRLEALDEQDKPLRSRNAQLTYLHILRLAAPSESSTPVGEEPPHRPWVVKVVKREAVIGSHTFRLQEIYGLASSSSAASADPTATTTNNNTDSNEPPATECVLCLSSPREVVLLPCRHLVACRECAVNMVEFGAGGQLTHEIEATATTAEGGATTATAGAGNDAAATTTGAVAATGEQGQPPARRRKRKAKGWFCPVCRQPYTALLRITTTPPGKRLSEESFHAPPVPAPPAPAHVAPTTQAEDAANASATAEGASTAGGGGVLSGLLGGLSLMGKKDGAPTTAEQSMGSEVV